MQEKIIAEVVFSSNHCLKSKKKQHDLVVNKCKELGIHAPSYSGYCKEVNRMIGDMVMRELNFSSMPIMMHGKRIV